MTQRYIGGLIYNPPGGYSGYFDGSGDYLRVDDATALNFGSGDFTVECWANISAHATFAALVCKGPVGSTDSTTWSIQFNSTANTLDVYINAANSGAQIIVGTTNVVNVGWVHVALSRSGSSTKFFINGVQEGSTYSGSYTIGSGNNLYVGVQQVGTGDFSRTITGYLSNIRLVKGTALYTAAFTPPNGPLQNITNTSLLTCRYPTFVDGSSNAFTITVNGNTTVSTQNPFPLTTLPNPAQGGAGNGIFSMSQYQSLKQQNLWPAIDPYFDYTTLLLHGNGTNGGQNNTFLDSSSNNFTITRNGNTTQGTFSPFSQTGWGNYFDGSGDYLSLSSTALNLGSNNFTVEAWVYTNATGQQCVVGSVRDSDGVGAWMFNLNYNSAKLRFFCRYGGGTVLDYTADAGTFPTSQWTHIAVTRSGANLRMFLNGTQLGTTNTTLSTSSIDNASTNYYIGQTTDGSSYFNGYISNLRVLTGTALYTANFTPPTAPLSAITNTTLLTCQSNRFVDNSASPLTLTPAGNTSVQAFSPFAPTAAYSASTVGGSGYFDGTGDYLGLSTQSAFPTSTQEFTVEFWAYKLNAWSTSNQYIFDSSASGGFQIWVNTGDGVLRLGRSAVAVVLDYNYSSLQINTWTHFAYSRKGNDFALWVNGTRVATTTNTNGFATANDTQVIGAPYTGSSSFWNGYLSSIRVVRGSYVYDTASSTITVPTAPLTAISGTSLLTNFTNAAIIDNTAKNVLETVGNAQISTTQSKFGGASLAFDGTGDYLSIVDKPIIELESGDFTMECWVYTASPTTRQTILAKTNSAGQDAFSSYYWQIGTAASPNTGILNFYHAAATTFVTAPFALAANTWYHIAIVRSGSSFTQYINGISSGTATSSTAMRDIVEPLCVGGALYGISLNGYIDDFRITKGIARYTSNFTPQTSQWQDQ